MSYSWEALYRRAVGLGQATYPCLYTDSKALWCHATEGAWIGPTQRSVMEHVPEFVLCL